MPEVKWIKISTGIFDDEKIKLIEAMPDSDTILIIWIKLLALAGRQNDSGQVYLTELTPYSDNMLAHIFNRKEATIRLAMKTFQAFGMIEVLGNQSILISNWAKHQNIDGLEKIRQGTRDRVRKFRLKQGSEENRSDKTRIEGNVTVTLQDNEGFEEFWSAYPKKIRKQKSREEWNRITDLNLEWILYSVKKFKNTRDWINDDGKYVPHPIKWLAERRWLDFSPKLQLRDSDYAQS